MKFSNEEIRMLAEQERRMDSGEQPFVIHMDQRWALSKECADELGIVSGQTVSSCIIRAMLEWNIADCQQEIAKQETEKAIATAQACVTEIDADEH